MTDLPDFTQWRKDGRHLPAFMRDFHDQKDLFKGIGELYAKDPAKMTPMERETYEWYHVDWVKAHCYTIEHFLWFMASRGYTLQKCRAKLVFKDIDETLKELNEARSALSAKLLNEFMGARKAVEPPEVAEVE